MCLTVSIILIFIKKYVTAASTEASRYIMSMDTSTYGGHKNQLFANVLYPLATFFYVNQYNFFVFFFPFM